MIKLSINSIFGHHLKVLDRVESNSESFRLNVNEVFIIAQSCQPLTHCVFAPGCYVFLEEVLETSYCDTF